ncbi:MAG TPA: permease-like cell division protein FtsX [Oscillospiraceae bacterium]|nr:permease-like cell division protein FtsX [Oscillospiraceae bacterium]
MRSSSFRYLVKEGFRSIWVNRLMSLASVAVLMACLLIVGCAAMVFMNIESMLDIVEAQNVIMVYVEDEATEYETSILKVELESTSNVSEVTFVSREEAFKAQLEKLGDGAEYLGALDASILPNAYKVKISDMAKFTETVNKIKEYQNILRIRESGDLANKLTVIRSSVTYVSVGLVILLFIVAVFIIANTVRITMFSRRLEISIMKAVGATNSFIRFPFMVEGVLIGVISGVVSFTVVWGLYELAASVFSNLLSVIGGTPIPFTKHALSLLFGFVIVGVFTGTFGSTFSMGKYLREQGSVVCEE